MIGVHMVFVDAVALIGVIYIAERVVHSHCFNLTDSTEAAEVAHECGLHASVAIVLQAILAEVAFARTALRRDDGEDGSVARAPVKRKAHWRSFLSTASGEDGGIVCGCHVDDSGAVRLEPEYEQPVLQALRGHGDVDGLSADGETILDVDVVRAIESGDSLPNLAVQPEHDDGSGRRLHFIGAKDQTSSGIGRVYPDGWIIRIIAYLAGTENRLNAGRLHLRGDRRGWLGRTTCKAPPSKNRNEPVPTFHAVIRN